MSANTLTSPPPPTTPCPHAGSLLSYFAAGLLVAAYNANGIFTLNGVNNTPRHSNIRKFFHRNNAHVMGIQEHHLSNNKSTILPTTVIWPSHQTIRRERDTVFQQHTMLTQCSVWPRGLRSALGPLWLMCSLWRCFVYGVHLTPSWCALHLQGFRDHYFHSQCFKFNFKWSLPYLEMQNHHSTTRHSRTQHSNTGGLSGAVISRAFQHPQDWGLGTIGRKLALMPIFGLVGQNCIAGLRCQVPVLLEHKSLTDGGPGSSFHNQIGQKASTRDQLLLAHSHFSVPDNCGFFFVTWFSMTSKGL